MKRTRIKRRGGLGRNAEKLIWLASGLAQSGSRAEDRHWELGLAASIDEQLEQHDEEVLNAALDHLFSADAAGYDELADFIESRAESVARLSADHDILLIAAPVLAWSRYRISATTIPPAALANLRVHLQAHVLADGARLALADFLFSPDQLPQGYCATAEFASTLGAAALDNHDVHIETDGMPETAQFLSDTRYLLAAVAVPAARPCSAGRNGTAAAIRHWRSGGPRAVPVLRRCCRVVPSKWCCPRPISPPAVPQTRRADPMRCGLRWPSSEPRSTRPPPICAQ